MPLHNLVHLRAPELRALPRDRTLFFIPVGPLEDHGDALPIGLDLDEARAIALRTANYFVAEGWECVLAPSVPLGVDANTGTSGVQVRAHVLRDYLVDFADSFARQGFRNFVVTSGNSGPRQLTTIEEAGKFLRKRYLRFGIFPNAKAPVLISANSVLIDDAEKSLSSLFMVPREHGGERDAGVALALAAEQVNAGLLRSQPKVETPRPGFSRWRALRKGEVNGYWGEPARGDAAKGNSLIDEKAKSLVLKLKAAIEGGKPHVVFKSWYSLIPSNQSLFKVWILVMMLTAVLAAWTVLSLETFLSGADFR